MQLRPLLKIPNKMMQLTINSSLILDAQGRQLDGNHDGQPGGNFVATLDRGGVINMARTTAEVRTGRGHAGAVDALMADGSFAGIVRRQPGRGISIRQVMLDR